MKYTIEEYSNAKDLVQAIQDGKCPVLVAENQTKSLLHAMVAYGHTKFGNDQYVKCKNSYGQDPSIPGNFNNYFSNYKIWKNYKIIKDILEIPVDGTANTDGWSVLKPMEAIYIGFS